MECRSKIDIIYNNTTTYLSIIIYNISKTINIKSKIVQEYLSKLSTFSQETFSGISVIKSYVVEDQKHVAFEKLSDESRKKQIDLSKIQALFSFDDFTHWM